MGQNYRIAVVANGVVENVILGDEDFTLPDKTLIRLSEVCDDGFDVTTLIDTPRGCPGRDWLYDGSTFTHPHDAPASIFELRDRLSQYRFAMEGAGIVWDGDRIGTAREDQRVFGEVRMRKAEYPDEEMSYKTKSGKFITATLAEFQPLAEAVYQHVQKCFRAEATISKKIEDGSITTINQVTEAFDVILA